MKFLHADNNGKVSIVISKDCVCNDKIFNILFFVSNKYRYTFVMQYYLC